MAENIARYIEGLQQELIFAQARGDGGQATAVKAEIAKARKRLGKTDKAEIAAAEKRKAAQAEAAVAPPEETPEDGTADSEKPVQPAAETPEGGGDGMVCPDCQKTFKNAGGLASHRRAKHDAI